MNGLVKPAKVSVLLEGGDDASYFQSPVRVRAGKFNTQSKSGLCWDLKLAVPRRGDYYLSHRRFRLQVRFDNLVVP